MYMNAANKCFEQVCRERGSLTILKFHSKICAVAVAVVHSASKKLIPVGNTTKMTSKVPGWQTRPEKQVNELRAVLNVVVAYMYNMRRCSNMTCQ